MRFISIILLVLITSCANTKSLVAQEISFDLILEGSHSNVNETSFKVIDNNESLKSIYSQLNITRKPGYPIPKINFNEDLIIALFMGQKNSGGFKIFVHEIQETNDSLKVFIKENVPDGVATSAITQPFYICKVPITTKPINFVLID